MHIAQFFRVNVPNLDLVLGVDIEQNPLALGKLQEPGREWGGGLEQSLRVVAAEQLDLPIPGGDGEDVEDGVVGEEGGVGGDAVVEGQPRAHVLGVQAADASEILLLGGLLDELLDEHGWPIDPSAVQTRHDAQAQQGNPPDEGITVGQDQSLLSSPEEEAGLRAVASFLFRSGIGGD